MRFNVIIEAFADERTAIAVGGVFPAEVEEIHDLVGGRGHALISKRMTYGTRRQ